MLRATSSHIYRLSDLLGKGASCHVYKGVHKKNGEERALKIFNVSLPAHMNEALRREVEALKSLTHPNVVTFHSLETEVNTGHQVLVMELCTGGTLLTVLAEPQYAFGLTEEEFLLFLSHTVSGLKHLRHNGFVHRDIKPGNILRNIGPDGKSVYKLSDFGSAKKLDLEEEEFVSMYGTEEYLHPDIFEKAFIDRSAVKHFTLAVDVWSIGATLYHAATGTVPFRPYGGRRNKTTMFKMITQKDSGIIAGEQKSCDGQIIWSQELPGTCILTHNLKVIVREICACMLEKNPLKMWTFETFFLEAEQLFSKTRVFLFNTLDCSSITLYLNPKDRLIQLQAALEKQIKLPIVNQVLFLGEKPLDAQVTQSTEIGAFPQTNSQKPIIIFTTATMDSQNLSPIIISEFPHLSEGPVSLDNDCGVVKLALDSQLGRQRVMDQCRISQELLCNGAVSFSSHVQSEVDHLNSQVDREMTGANPLSDFIRHLVDKQEEEETDRHMYDFAEGDDPAKEKTKRGKELHDIREKTLCVIKKLAEIKTWCKTTREEDSASDLSCEKALDARFGLKPICPPDCECVTRPKWQHNELLKLSKKFEERRKNGRLAYHEEQLHNFDRRSLTELCSQSKKLLAQHCLTANDRVFKSFKGWHLSYQQRLKDLKHHRTRLTAVTRTLEECQFQFNQYTSELRSVSHLPMPAPLLGPPHHSHVTPFEKKKQERRIEINRVLQSVILPPFKETASLREEMSDLQESIHSMAKSLGGHDEPEVLSFDDVLLH